MKTLKLILVAFAGALLLSSCKKWYPDYKEITDKAVVGIWTLPNESKQNAVTWYWELNSNGHLTYYEISENGVARYDSNDHKIHQTKNTKWNKSMSGTYRQKFNKERDRDYAAISTIYYTDDTESFIRDIEMGTIYWYNYNSAYLSSSWLKQGIVYRVNGFASDIETVKN